MCSKSARQAARTAGVPFQRSIGWTALPSILPFVSAVAAQSPTIIRDPPACVDCTLDVERVATLGTADGPGILEGLTIVTRDARGRYYAFRNGLANSISVFAANGEYLTTIGREGQGPGEYRFILRVFHSGGDTLHVFDAMNLRRTVLSPTYDVVRTHMMPTTGLVETIVVDGDSIVVATALRDPRRAGLPIHWIDGSGSIARSFGAADGPVDPRRLGRDRRLLAPTGTGDLWSIHVSRLDAEEWTRAGTMRRRFSRDAPWFVTPDSSDRQGAPNPPRAVVLDAREDSRGRLWILARIADETWADASVSGPGPHGPTIHDHNTYYDTVLEILDPARGIVLARRRFDRWFTRFLDDTAPQTAHEILMAATVYDAVDVPYVEIWRARMQEER